jgi:hypothetical protein
VDFDDESPFNRKFRRKELKMAKTGYILATAAAVHTATVSNILYWNRGYSTAAAGVWRCHC